MAGRNAERKVILLIVRMIFLLSLRQSYESGQVVETLLHHLVDLLKRKNDQWAACGAELHVWKIFQLFEQSARR